MKFTVSLGLFSGKTFKVLARKVLQAESTQDAGHKAENWAERKGRQDGVLLLVRESGVNAK